MPASLDHPEPVGLAEPDWESLQRSPEFARLRKAVRGFAFPMTAAFLVWYVLYVLLADYAHGFMSTKVFGNVNLGLILGILQFVTTFTIAIMYARYAGRKMDPLADQLRAEIEGGSR